MPANYCPDCQSALPMGATSCGCGWTQQQAKGGIKCLCGRFARIKFRGAFMCWACYENTLEGTSDEDWRSSMVRDYVEKNGLTRGENESERDYLWRVKEQFRKLGGVGGVINARTTVRS